MSYVFSPKILSSHERPRLMQLTLAEMQRFFTIIILGLVASVAVLLAEVIVKAKLDHTKKCAVFKDARNNSMGKRDIRASRRPETRKNYKIKVGTRYINVNL